MSCIVFIACFGIMATRLRRGVTPLVPAALCLVALLSVVLAILALIRTFSDVANVAPADKATLMAAGIAEAMNALVFRDLVALPPLLAGAYFLDRRLRRRRPVPAGPAQAAPEGSRCANHPEERALMACPRCGTFVCDACSAADRRLCTSCFGRLAPPA